MKRCRNLGKGKQGEKKRLADIIIEGKTVGTNGTVPPNTTLNQTGKRVPIQDVTKVNAPCN